MYIVGMCVRACLHGYMSSSTHQHMHQPTHLVCLHQQLRAPYLTQELDNLQISQMTCANEDGPGFLHTLAVRPPACAVSSTPSTRSALLLSLLASMFGAQGLRVMCTYDPCAPAASRRLDVCASSSYTCSPVRAYVGGACVVRIDRM
jgi:hypothetical protein